MSKKLEGKIALITGSSRGICAAIAKRLAADGAKVAITYTKGADAARTVVKAIERAGGKAIAIQATPRMLRPAKPRSKRPLRPSAGSTSL
jgi:3-oxoacyl-[acyl-carrier protein] reductase